MMSREVKARLVRCHHCMKLLQENPEHSIYRCGNCGALIQAKNPRSSTCVDSETVPRQEVNESSESSLHEDSREEIRMSEGPSTSPETASPSHDQSLDRKGKAKQVDGHGEDARRNIPDRVFALRSHVQSEKDETEHIHFTSSKRGFKHVPYDNLDQKSQETLDYEAPSFRRSGWLDTSSASPPRSDVSSGLQSKLELWSKSPATPSYYAGDRIESYYDEEDDEKHDKFSWRLRKDDELRYKSTRGMLHDDVKVQSYRSSDGGAIRSPYTQRDASRLPFNPRDLFTDRSGRRAHGFNFPWKLKQWKETNQRAIMRKIKELEDQLKVISKFPLHRSLPLEDHKPGSYHYHNLRQQETQILSYHDDHHCISRCGSSRQSTRYEDQEGSPCSHVYLEDCLSKRLHINSRGHFPHSGDIGPDISHSVSRHHYTGRNHSSGIETNIEENMRQVNLKKISQPVMKSLLAVEGAPFVACSFCRELLQLPSGFIISKRGYNKLRCGTCKKILRF